MNRLRRFLVFLALAFSFGGFTFYTSVVVPIGGHVLGASTQGFVTQQVTHVLNGVTAATALLLIWELLAGKSHRSRHATIIMSASIFVLLVSCIILALLHVQLDAYLDTANQAVNEHDTFYSLHRVYLWVSMLQWLAMFPLVWFVATASVATENSATLKPPER